MNKLLKDETLKTLRSAFPILKSEINEKPLIYFDNAATSQKPHAMLDGLKHYYTTMNANSHRGVHELARQTTEAYEAVRLQIADWFGVKENEILFNSGTTMGLNFVAQSLVKPQLTPGSKVLVTVLEHHSNLVPWQEIAKATGAELVYIPVDPETYLIDLDALEKELDDTVKAVAIHHVSNVIGVEQPIQEITQLVRQKTQAFIIADGAQAAPHMRVNLKELNVDAYLMSAHKMYGPTGLGIAYLNERVHALAAPFLFGGEMINVVGDHSSDFKNSPWRYEAGTQPIAEVIAFGKVLQFLQAQNLEALYRHEQALTNRLIEGLTAIPGISLYRSATEPHHGIVSFNIDGVHPHDAATGYDLEGIAVRAGHHCAQPLMRYLGVVATLRASLSFYNTPEEVDYFVSVTERIKEFFTGGFR